MVFVKLERDMGMRPFTLLSKNKLRAGKDNGIKPFHRKHNIFSGIFGRFANYKFLQKAVYTLTLR